MPQDIYKEVTNKIIRQLEKGIFPWAQPWSNTENISMPHNAISGNAYSGINVLLLWAEQASLNYSDNSWLTYKQAAKLGGYVRKGEHGTQIVYASKFVPKEEKRAESTGEEPASVYLMKSYVVFNIAQCDNLPDDIRTPAAARSTLEQHAQSESLITATSADFRVGGNKAYYNPATDHI